MLPNAWAHAKAQAHCKQGTWFQYWMKAIWRSTNLLYMIEKVCQTSHTPKTTLNFWCHGTTSFLSFLIFVCPLPHLHHLPTPSALICLPSTASAPTPRCTHATMLCPHLD